MLVNQATGEVLDPFLVQTKIQALSEVLPEFEEGMNKSAEKSGALYKIRNWLLGTGFLLLVAAKVWYAYA
jgi:hypothetical protein